jgi:hypothetical protein
MKEIIDGQEDEEGGKIESISKKKAEDLVEIIRSGMQSSRKAPSSISSKQQESSVQVQSLTIDKEVDTNKIQSSSHLVTSIADELSKLAKLRNQGVITEAEFVKMKSNLIDGR